MDFQKKVKDALNEGRILILGSQILIGFQWHCIFESGYDKLPSSSQWLGLLALLAALVLLGMLVAPVCYHKIVVSGEDTPDLHAFCSRSTELALVPFSAVLGTDLFLSSSTLLSPPWAFGIGLAGFLVAVFFWFGIEAFAVRRSAGPKPDKGQPKKTELSAKIDHVLTEARMVLPGAQALLGFQFILFFSDNFPMLPESSKWLHLASLGLVCLCVVLLMTPASFHRIVEGGEDTDRFYQIASRLVLAAMVPLALAASIEFYIVAEKVSPSGSFAPLAAACIAAYFFLFWFGFTYFLRVRRSKGSGQ